MPSDDPSPASNRPRFQRRSAETPLRRRSAMSRRPRVILPSLTPGRLGMPKLRAIVSVDSGDSVLCQHAGCGRKVYAAIHVVEIEGRLKLLGSTCFAIAFGTAGALGRPQFGGGGTGGRRLTDEERELLVHNTLALLERFQAEDTHAAAQMHAYRSTTSVHAKPSGSSPPPWQQHPRARSAEVPLAIGTPTGARSPWSWQKKETSIAVVKSPEGRAWIRVQHEDGSQKLVPWPQFSGWDRGAGSWHSRSCELLRSPRVL